MASMAIPIRVSGGRIEEGRMRYHATPVGGVPAQEMEQLSPSVAAAIGAESVAIRAEQGEVTIDVSPALGARNWNLTKIPPNRLDNNVKTSKM